MGDGSGIDVCREIRSRDESIRAIILTSYDDDDALFAIMAGSAGCVLKQIHDTDLVDGIRREAAGQSPRDPWAIPPQPAASGRTCLGRRPGDPADLVSVVVGGRVNPAKGDQCRCPP